MKIYEFWKCISIPEVERNESSWKTCPPMSTFHRLQPVGLFVLNDHDSSPICNVRDPLVFNIRQTDSRAKKLESCVNTITNNKTKCLIMSVIFSKEIFDISLWSTIELWCPLFKLSFEECSLLIRQAQCDISSTGIQHNQHILTFEGLKSANVDDILLEKLLKIHTEEV